MVLAAERCARLWNREDRLADRRQKLLVWFSGFPAETQRTMRWPHFGHYCRKCRRCHSNMRRLVFVEPATPSMASCSSRFLHNAIACSTTHVKRDLSIVRAESHC